MRFLPPQAIPLLHAVWRHKWLGVATAWLVCTAGWIGVALVPTKYESSARVYLNADPLLTPLLRGLAADTVPTRQLVAENDLTKPLAGTTMSVRLIVGSSWRTPPINVH